ncbi:MAG: transposase [Lachnospiraceae bacterium]|nr:transposase [Lachnospiraceae bacterium]
MHTAAQGILPAKAGRGRRNGLKKDIAPVKNAISLDVSSGFVEGNNNKFKLIKRIVYGRSKIVNLTKKCKLAFLIKTDDFNLMDLI